MIPSLWDPMYDRYIVVRLWRKLNQLYKEVILWIIKKG